MNAPGTLRREAGTLAAPLPPLLAEAERLAATVLLGEHGRRRSGAGDEFWQYRAAVAGDEARLIDWRRSARSDTHFVRQKEWLAVQSVLIWTDLSKSMGFASDKNLPAKADRARVLTLAISMLLLRAGERVGLADSDVPAQSGEGQIYRLADALTDARGRAPDYGAPELNGLRSNIRALFLSDFLGDPDPVERALTKAADRGVKGAILHILDPAEEAFPYSGRTIFESMGGALRHETQKARDLRDRYRERLAERKAWLDGLCRATGWLYQCHHTDQSAARALLWLFAATERRRR